MNIEKLTKMINEKLIKKGDETADPSIIIKLKETEVENILSNFEISENKDMDKLKIENESLRFKKINTKEFLNK